MVVNMKNLGDLELAQKKGDEERKKNMKEKAKELADTRILFKKYPEIEKKYEKLAEGFEPWKRGYAVGFKEGREGVIKEIKFLEMLLKWDIDKENATTDKPIKERILKLKKGVGVFQT